VNDELALYLGQAAFERLLRQARRRVEDRGVEGSTVTLEQATPDELAALTGLLGPRMRPASPGRDVKVRLDAIDDALRASRFTIGLRDALAVVHGEPVTDRSAQRAAAVALNTAGWQAARAHPALSRHPTLGAWLERSTTRARLTRAASLTGVDRFVVLARILDALARLPAEPRTSLARFAAATASTDGSAGDPHLLDSGRPLRSLLLAALAHLAPEQTEPLDEGDDAGAAAVRELLDRFGIPADDLVATVLVSGLRPSGSGWLERALREAADAGQPRVLCLRELRGVFRLALDGDVFCVENPDVMTAALDAFGARCPPLLCTAGWPSTAGSRVLRALRVGGARVRHHGDMDWDGLRILAYALRRSDGIGWRMTVADYAVHCDAGAPLADDIDIEHPELRELAAAMRHERRAVREELVIDDLLADLDLYIQRGRPTIRAAR
jgi:uncharacterized protein (TIGR02679 family)